MNKKSKKEKRKSKILAVISQHVMNHKKEYITVTLLFLLGIILGIICINYIDETQFVEIQDYIKSMASSIKNTESINFMNLLKKSILSNVVLTIILWISASTIIGIPIVYGVIVFRGFALGYTISSIVVTFGKGSGILYAFSSLLLHNIVFIPILLATSVSGIKLYQSIIKNKNKENVKIEFVRHTIFCAIMLLLLMVSALIETYISTNLGKFVLNYIKI